MKRRRYDTVELVADIKRERRNGILLGLAGVGILIVLLGLYVTSVGDEQVPTLPVDSNVSPARAPDAGQPAERAVDGAASAKPTVGTATGARTPESGTDAAGPAGDEDTEDEAKEVAALSEITIVLTKKALLWIDGKKIGKLKRHKLELTPGEHELKAKFGRKLVTLKVVPKPGQAYEVRFDAKRKRAAIKKIQKIQKK